MDKIWYRNPSKSEVIGCCGGDEKKRMTTQNRQKSTLKKPVTLVEYPMSMHCLVAIIRFELHV